MYYVKFGDDILYSEQVYLNWIFRIVLATLCGCAIGYERTSRNKSAGIRTHAIIALGSSMFMIISKYAFFDVSTADGARVAAQIVSGIGFLGAGVIFVKDDLIQGLTTAAGMWTTSGIAACIGAGLIFIGVFATLFLVVLQKIFHYPFFNPDKVNYGAYGDMGHHLHFHLVPKYKDGYEWGGVFAMNPGEKTLSDEEYQDMVEKYRAILCK